MPKLSFRLGPAFIYFAKLSFRFVGRVQKVGSTKSRQYESKSRQYESVNETFFSFRWEKAAAGYFVSFQVSFRLGAREATKRKESFSWLLKRNPGTDMLPYVMEAVPAVLAATTKRL